MTIRADVDHTVKPSHYSAPKKLEGSTKATPLFEIVRPAPNPMELGPALICLGPLRIPGGGGPRPNINPSMSGNRRKEQRPAVEEPE